MVELVEVEQHRSEEEEGEQHVRGREDVASDATEAEVSTSVSTHDTPVVLPPNSDGNEAAVCRICLLEAQVRQGGVACPPSPPGPCSL